VPEAGIVDTDYGPFSCYGHFVTHPKHEGSHDGDHK
jgi:hypothetical protein